MRNVIMLASALLIGHSSAATVTGTQTTPLTLTVNNFCQLAGLGGSTPTTFDRTNAPLNIGSINAVTQTILPLQFVGGVDCNYKTAVNVRTPTSVVLTNATGDTVNITTDAWDDQHPLTMTFRQDFRTVDDGYGPYQFYGIEAGFVLGGSPTFNRAFSIPGGVYTGDLVITFDYTE